MWWKLWWDMNVNILLCRVCFAPWFLFWWSLLVLLWETIIMNKYLNFSFVHFITYVWNFLVTFACLRQKGSTWDMKISAPNFIGSTEKCHPFGDEGEEGGWVHWNVNPDFGPCKESLPYALLSKFVPPAESVFRITFPLDVLVLFSKMNLILFSLLGPMLLFQHFPF